MAVDMKISVAFSQAIVYDNTCSNSVDCRVTCLARIVNLRRASTINRPRFLQASPARFCLIRFILQYFKMYFSLSFISSLLILFITVVSSSLTITIPPSTLLPNPNVLPAGTHATLTTSNPNGHLTAPLTRSATFVFRNLNPQTQSQTQSQSYLLDIRSAEYVFAPFRVDVAADGRVLGVWETFRGNPWDNRGTDKYNVVVDGVATAPAEVEHVRVDARVVAKRGFYEQRAKCRFSPFFLVLLGFWIVLGHVGLVGMGGYG